MEAFLKYGITEFFKKKKSSPKKQILDPLSTVLRLALLKFKPVGTKISIHNNSIWTQSPTLIQGAVRWGYGDMRDDLHNLYEPIYAATQWYSANGPEAPFRSLFQASIDGLRRLKKVYKDADESNLVIHSIIHYVTLLEGAIRDGGNIVEPIPPWDTVWTPTDIEIVLRLLVQCEFYANEPLVDYYIQALESIIDSKDQITRRILGSIIQIED